MCLFQSSDQEGRLKTKANTNHSHSKFPSQYKNFTLSLSGPEAQYNTKKKSLITTKKVKKELNF